MGVPTFARAPTSRPPISGQINISSETFLRSPQTFHTLHVCMITNVQFDKLIAKLAQIFHRNMKLGKVSFTN